MDWHGEYAGMAQVLDVDQAGDGLTIERKFM